MNKAHQLAITPLHCIENGVQCPMSVRGNACEQVASTMIQAALRHDPTYEPDGRIPLPEAAGILTEHLKLGSVVLAVGTSACRAAQAFYNQTAAESPMASIYS